MNIYLLLFKFHEILIQWKKYWKYDSYFNEESDYPEESTSDNEHFCSTILQPFQFEPKQKQTCGNESYEKETKHIHVSAANLTDIRKVDLD